VFPSWADYEAIRGLDIWWKGAKLNLTNANLTKTEFDSVVVEMETFKITESSSLLDLVLEVLLNGAICWNQKRVESTNRVSELTGVP
jgi:hypothetical protein